MKKILLFSCFMTLLFLTSDVKSQDLPWYYPGTEHPAYLTALSFSSDPDFIRGFCFAFDGAHEMVNFGTANIAIKEVEIGGPNSAIKISIGMHLISVANWQAAATTFVESSAGVRDYAYSLVDLSNQNLWLGYAAFMELAAGNPQIVNLMNGQVV